MQHLTGAIMYTARVERQRHGYRARVLFDFDGTEGLECGETRRRESDAYKDITSILRDVRGE